MLIELSVKNFALIESLKMDFGPGFSVISGETGAGKSILVGALDLLTGGKASPVLVRTGEKEAIIEAALEIENHPVLAALLDEMGLSPEEDRLLIRRHISSEGRSRIYLNGKQATLAQLEEVASHLIDLSGQHAQQTLLHQKNHLSLLDAASPKPFRQDLEKYSQAYSKYNSLKTKLEDSKRQALDREKRVDFLKFQIHEIEAVSLNSETEEDDLLIEKAKVKNADFLSEMSRFAVAAVSDSDTSALNALNELLARLDKASAMDESLKEAAVLIKEAKPALEELSRFFSRYADGLSVRPGRLEEIESRLYAIYKLKRKYGSTITEILAHFDECKKELSLFEHFEENVAIQEKEINAAAAEVMALAAQLSKARKSQAVKFEKAIQAELADLSMPNVFFHIRVDPPATPDIDACGPKGWDDVYFEMTANKGEKPQPLAAIASGGELSRILLSIKKVLGTRAHPMTYIFDEIDAGIGGGVAEVVGRKLKEIADGNQVFCITHAPQIASFADAHFVVEKYVTAERTQTGIRVLAGAKERELEIARMLGGLTITDKTRAHAREMLGAAKK